MNEEIMRRDEPRQLARFQIQERLGVGASGTVYRAYDPVLRREVALKVLSPAALENPETRRRFLREPKAAARLQHPHLVPVYDAGNEGAYCYVASALIEGRTLAACLAEKRLTPREAARMVRDLADALAHAHELGVIHRDVKPANIMLDAREQPLLMDFGLAQLGESEEKLTQDGTLIGTPAYMAPERVDRSLGEAGPAGDQYSLGVVLYEMLCGEPPFSGPPAVVLHDLVRRAPCALRDVCPTIPRDLESICLKAMAKRPRERYEDCGKLAEDLRRWLDDEPVRARPMGVLERAVKWTRRNPLLGGMAAVVVVLALVSTLLAASLFLSRGEVNLALARGKEKEEMVRGRRPAQKSSLGRPRPKGSVRSTKRRSQKQKAAAFRSRWPDFRNSPRPRRPRMPSGKRSWKNRSSLLRASSGRKRRGATRPVRESRPTNGPQRPNKRCRP